MLSNEMKRHAVIVAIHAEHADTEIAVFLKLARSFVHKVRAELEDSQGDVASVAKRKLHATRSDNMRTPEFVAQVRGTIDASPGTSMRSLAREFDVSEGTIRNVVHEDLRYKSYVMRRGQFMSQAIQDNRLLRSRMLLNKLKHPESPGELWFFSDEKNFDQDQKVNRRNDRWLCNDPSEVPTVMHTKFPASLMVLGVVSSEGHVMPPHFFEQGLRLNADGYVNVLQTVVKPWIDEVSDGRPYVVQQDSAPCHKAKKTQDWMADHFHDHVTPNMWPPSSPDLNPLDYYVWGVVERDTNQHRHNTLGSLREAVVASMANINQDHLVRACQRFRSRVEAVIRADGGYIE
jgi:inhibitor of nuclear factor kappa-B kinase subunit alpha